MRFSRAKSALLTPTLSLFVLVGACSSVDVPGAGQQVEVERSAEERAGLTPQTPSADDLALRTPSNGVDSPLGDIGADAPADRPTPPTLSGQEVKPASTAPPLTGETTITSPPVGETTAPTTPPAGETTVQATAPEATAAPSTTPESTTVASDPTTPPDPTTSPEAGPGLEPGEQRSLTLLNELRSGLGVAALTRVGEMDAFARDWSRQMAESGAFEHSNGPYGENIAFTSNTRLTAAQAAEVFHDLWVNSSGHYANMTNGEYTKTGVGLYLTERGWYGTHVFAF